MALRLSMFRVLSNFGMILCFVGTTSCQRKPALAPSADPFSAIEAPPMGGDTYNDELKRELSILERVLDNTIEPAQLARVKTALMTGNQEAIPKDKSDESYLAKVFLTLPELVHPRERLSDNRKLWLTAKFLFLKRRFVEAAMKMTTVLKSEPDFVEARNWRARAIFFLGNPDLAIRELETIMKRFPAKSSESLDALYLIGAIIYESNDNEKHRIATGIRAWERYLEVAEPSPDMKSEILQSLAELKVRHEGKAKPAPSIDPFIPSEGNTAEKNAILVAFAKEELGLALELADKFLKKSYDNAIAVVKARILFKNGRLDDAAELFLAIVTKDKTYAPGYHYQGMAFMLKGEPEHAIASWQKTVALDPSYAHAHGLVQRIAVAQKMVGDKGKGG
jgi:tetratricopeptide (TPR) repeat protein